MGPHRNRDETGTNGVRHAPGKLQLGTPSLPNGLDANTVSTKALERVGPFFRRKMLTRLKTRIQRRLGSSGVIGKHSPGVRSRTRVEGRLASRGTLRAKRSTSAPLDKVVKTLFGAFGTANGLAAQSVSAGAGGIGMIFHLTRAKPPNLGLCGIGGILHGLKLGLIRLECVRELQWSAAEITKD